MEKVISLRGPPILEAANTNRIYFRYSTTKIFYPNNLLSHRKSITIFVRDGAINAEPFLINVYCVFLFSAGRTHIEPHETQNHMEEVVDT